MHIHKFADIASFAEIGVGGIFRQQKSTGIHQKAPPYTVPDRTADSSVIQVEYSYVTVRGNYRKAYKYILLAFGA